MSKEPSEFSYYISDRVTVGAKKPTVNLLTNEMFDKYIQRMKHGLPEEAKQALKRARSKNK